MLEPDQLLLYTFFVVNVTVVFFIAGIYFYAYRFLEERFYIALACGWVVNGIYLAFETVLLLIKPSVWPRLSLSLTTAALGIISSPLFHRAVQISSETHGGKEGQRHRWYIPTLVGLLLVSISLTGAAFTHGLATRNEHWIFAIIILPSVAYAIWVLLMVASHFRILFPEEEYGTSSKVLYFSWIGYAALQLIYPFKLFDNLHSLLLFFFIVAFATKVTGVVALLYLLKESYSAATTELRESSVLADIGNLAAGLHHDIATPLGRIDAELTLLAQKRNTDEIVKQALEKIRKPMRLISAAVKFVDFVRKDPDAVASGFGRVAAREPLNFAISLFKKQFSHTDLRIVPPPQSAPTYYVRANSDLLTEAFLNIIKNAHEASARVLNIIIRKTTDSPPQIVYSFENNGRQLTEEELKNCFLPGWSSKDKTENKANTGMGLYMCSRIIKMHRGTVEIRNKEAGGGVVVSVSMPAARHVADSRSKEEEQQYEFAGSSASSASASASAGTGAST